MVKIEQNILAKNDGYAERKSARAMLETELPGSRRITLGADKGYDAADFVASCRALKVTPHIARNESRAGGSWTTAGAVEIPLSPATRSTPWQATTARAAQAAEW